MVHFKVTNAKTIPLIPHCLVNDQLITYFLIKENLCNEFLSQQCNTIDNEGTFLRSEDFKTTSRTWSFDSCNDGTTRNIWLMDMIEISFKCYSLVLFQYQNLFSLPSKHSLEKECFPKEWNNANTVLIHTKGNKQLIENYSPVLPLMYFPSSSKSFNYFD